MSARGDGQEFDLQDDDYCVVCGSRNPYGLKLNFIQEGSAVIADFLAAKEQQGYAGIVHGGILALIFDEIMVQVLWKQKRPAVSVHFEMRLRCPALVGQNLSFRAWIAEEKRGIIFTQSECRSDAGTLIATAQAKCREMSRGDLK